MQVFEGKCLKDGLRNGAEASIPVRLAHRLRRAPVCRRGRPWPVARRIHATVSTANGTVKAAPARLAMVDLGGIIVRDVDAMVLPDEVLSENLLGLSFLSKLKRFEYANGLMALEQ
jgi:hypothetical protein